MSSAPFSRDGGIILPADVIGNISLVQKKVQKCMEKRDQLCENWADGQDLATRIGFPGQEDLDEIKDNVHETSKQLEDLMKQGEVLKQTVAPILEDFGKLSIMSPDDFSAYAAKARVKMTPIWFRLLPTMIGDMPDVLKKHPALQEVVENDFAFLQDNHTQARQADQEQVDRLEARVNELTEELQTSQNLASHNAKELRRLRVTITRANERVQRYHTSEVKTSADLATAQAEVEGLQQHTDELEQQLERQKEIAADYLQQRDNQTRLAKQAAELMAQKDANMIAIQQRFEDTISAWPTAATAHNMYHQQIDKLIVDHRTETTRHDGFVETLTRSHEAIVRGLQSQITSLSEEKSRASVDLAEMATKLRRKTALYGELAEDLETSQQVQQSLRDSLALSRATLTKERDQLMSKNTSLEEELKLCQQGRADLLEWGDQLDDKLSGSKKKWREIRKEYEASLRTHQATHTKTEQNMSRVIAEREQARKAVGKLKSEKSALERERTKAVRELKIQQTELEMASADAETRKLLNVGLKHDLRARESKLEKVGDDLNTCKELLKAAKEELKAKQDILRRNDADALEAVEALQAMESQRDEEKSAVGRLETHLRDLMLKQSEEDNEQVANSHATRLFLSRVSGCADPTDMDGLFRAIVAEEAPAHAPTQVNASKWSIEETWTEDMQHNMKSVTYPYGMTMESAVLCLASAAASRTLASAYCQIVTCKLTEHVKGSTTIPVEVLSELAGLVVRSLDPDQEYCFEMALTFRQLMALVDRRLRNRLPDNAKWHALRAELSVFLGGHQYGDVYRIWLGDLAPEDSPLYRVFSQHIAMYSHGDWSYALVLNTNLQTLRFIDKAQWNFDMQVLEMNLPLGQPPIVLELKDGDFDWALGLV